MTRLLAVLVTLSLGAAAPAAAQEEIKIGVILPLTGAAASTGNELKNASELAAQIVNDDVKDLALPLAAGVGLPSLKNAKIRLVFADHQTSGRGRLGRTWFSPQGAGLYVSIVIRPDPRARAGTAGTGSPPWRSGQKCRRWARAAAWKVRAAIPGRPSPASRSAISPAALSVKVTTRTRRGSTAPVATA